MKTRHSKRVYHLLFLALVSTLLIACVSEQSLSEATEEPVTAVGPPPTTFLSATVNPTATPSPASPTPKPTLTPTLTQTPVPTPMPTATPTPTPAPTLTAIPTQTPVPTPAPTATPTPTPAPTLIPAPTQTPVPTPAPTARPEPISGDFTSEGVNVVGALPWHEAGYKGQGVKVGIIETGFEGFAGLVGQELPSPVGIRCYTDAGGVFSSALKDCENGDVHGTATTETIIDTAPGVSLYIARVRNKRDLRDTVNWMVEEGVSVATLYGFGRFEGPGDGTSPDPLSALGLMDLGVNGGIMFVVPAGNFATGTWFKRAPFSDADGDTFIDFASNNDGNAISLEEGDRASFQLRWDDTWAAASRNLELHIWDTAAQQHIAHSRSEQSGRAGDVPYETLRFQAPRDGVYEVAISSQDGDVPEWIQLLYWGQGLEHHTESGSIINPAESANPSVLTVGAAHWEDIHTIAWYSSRGPTPDGRIKPDIVGPTCGESASFHPRRYCGTSGSTPHLVGMAALVKQRFPHYGPEQVAEYLKDHAEQRQTPDPNNTWGHGFAVLPPPNTD